MLAPSLVPSEISLPAIELAMPLGFKAVSPTLESQATTWVNTSHLTFQDNGKKFDFFHFITLHILSSCSEPGFGSCFSGSDSGAWGARCQAWTITRLFLSAVAVTVWGALFQAFLHLQEGKTKDEGTKGGWYKKEEGFLHGLDFPQVSSRLTVAACAAAFFEILVDWIEPAAAAFPGATQLIFPFFGVLAISVVPVGLAAAAARCRVNCLGLSRSSAAALLRAYVGVKVISPSVPDGVNFQGSVDVSELIDLSVPVSIDDLKVQDVGVKVISRSALDGVNFQGSVDVGELIDLSVPVSIDDLKVQGTTTLSQAGQADLPRGVGRPRGKSLPWQQPQAAAASVFQVIGEDCPEPETPETEHEVHQLKGESGENATFQVLVKQLSGQHLAVSVKGDWLVAELAQCFQLRSSVPAESFYLVKAGRHLHDSKTLGEEEWGPGDTIHMYGRLRGGSSNFASHADWHCASCDRGGCWASRLQCYRCGLPRSESERVTASMPHSKGKKGGRAAGGRGVHVPPRETQFPGKSAGPQMSSCPTWRVPRQQKAKRNDTPPPPQDSRADSARAWLLA